VRTAGRVGARVYGYDRYSIRAALFCVSSRLWKILFFARLPRAAAALGLMGFLDVLKVCVKRTQIKGREACIIRVEVPEGADPSVAYAEYVRKLEEKCRAKIGVIVPAGAPLQLFLALLKATAEVLGAAAVATAEGIRIVYADGELKPGELLRL